MIDIKSRIVNSSQVAGTIDPFVLAIAPLSGMHTVCWMEWHEGNGFDEDNARQSPQPQFGKNNSIERFRLLPKLQVVIDGRKMKTFRAVCDRSMGGKVGVIACDGGTLWTVLP